MFCTKAPQVQSDPQLLSTPPQIGLQKLAKWNFVGPNRTAPLQGYWHEEVSKGRRRLYKVSQTAGTWPQFCQNWGQNEKSQ